jgi:hypothetical protein
MEKLRAALDALNALNDRLHDLVDPDLAFRSATVAVVAACGEAVVELSSRITALESHPAVAIPPLQPQPAADQKSPGTEATTAPAAAAVSQVSDAAADDGDTAGDDKVT